MVRSIPALISLALFSTLLNAQPAPAASAPAAADDAASCIEVEVNGEKTPSFACLTQKLRPAADAQKNSPPPAFGSEAIILRPSNQLGLFNRAATSNRMGNTFGTSVYPQRPPPQVPATPLIPNARP